MKTFDSKQPKTPASIISDSLLVFDFLMKDYGSFMTDEQKQMILDCLRTIFAKKLCSQEDFNSLAAYQIKNLCTIALIDSYCRKALREGKTTIAKLAELDERSLRRAIESDDYPKGDFYRPKGS